MSNDFNKSVGQRLYQARKAKGYSRAKVGELVGLHETTVKRYEDGDIKTLDIERLKEFARVLGTPASELIGWTAYSDDHLGLMVNISEESASGRAAAKEDMFHLFGTEHSTAVLRLMDDKVAFLYYKALDRNAAPALADLVSTVDDMNTDGLENIRLLVRAYLKAEEPIKDIVDTALRPYREEEALDAQIG